MARCRPVAVSILAAALAFGPASAETDTILLCGCLPPEDPYQFDLPDDPELRQMINEDYQSFIREAETYINCLAEERDRAFRKTQVVLRRYVEVFGRDAALQFPAD